jgi:SAM-dependent methyltransferase
LVEIDASEGVNADNSPAKMLHGIEYRVMLDGAAHDDAWLRTARLASSGPARAEHGEIVCLSSTARVNDVAGLGTEQFGEFVACLINGATGVAGKFVGAGGIREAIRKEWEHRLDSFGTHRSRGSMIKVGTHPPKGTGADRHWQTVMVSDDAALYGNSFADVYDDWYGEMFDTDGAVQSVIDLAGGRPVCELGVGTGRLAIPLAQSGLQVLGIDASQPMLDLLEAKKPPASLQIVLGDMSRVADVVRDQDLSIRFGLVLCAFNTFLNLTTAEDQRRCVQQVASLLDDGGRFVIENFVPVDANEMRGARDVPSAVHSDVPVLTSTSIDTANQLIIGEHIEQRSEGSRRRPWKVRYVTVSEFDEFAAAAGLRLEQRWSDWHGSRFDSESSVSVSIYLRQ